MFRQCSLGEKCGKLYQKNKLPKGKKRSNHFDTLLNCRILQDFFYFIFCEVNSAQSFTCLLTDIGRDPGFFLVTLVKTYRKSSGDLHDKNVRLSSLLSLFKVILGSFP